MSEPYELTLEHSQGTLILRARGKFDEAAGEAVATHISAHGGDCVLNMSSVDYISSTGVAFLAKLSAARGLRIAAPAECVRNMVSLAGIERILSISEAREEAEPGQG